MFRRFALSILLLALHSIPLTAEGIPLAGRVVGTDGTPRAKVRVSLEPLPSSYDRAFLRLADKEGPAAISRTTTDTDGAFELTAPEAGMWTVVVEAPGMLTMECRLVPLVETAVLPTVELRPAAQLEVRLVDSQGKPRPGRIGALTVEGSGAWQPRLRLAAAGDDGTAHIPLGQGETIRLEALAEGHPLVVYEVVDESSVDIRLPTGKAAKIRFLDHQKRPIHGAVAIQGSALLPLAQSDEEGRLQVVVQAKDAPAVKVLTANSWNGSFELDPGPGEEEEQVLYLEPPTTIRGRVLSQSNREPVAGALVWSVRGEHTISDTKGRYSLDLGVYRSSWIYSVAAGYLRGRSRIGEAGEPVAVGLAPSASLAGKVVDQAGQPVEGATYSLLPGPAHDPRSLAASSALQGERASQTPEDGTFRVVGLPTEAGFELVVEAPGYAPHNFDIEPLEPFEHRSGLSIVLRAGHRALGRVVDEHELPIAGAEVRLDRAMQTQDLRLAMQIRRRSAEEEDPAVHTTDGEGRFEVSDLAPGRYDLSVKASGFSPARVPGIPVDEHTPTSDLGTIVLAPGASIEGRVTDADGNSIEGAEIIIQSSQRGLGRLSAGAPPERLKTGSDGQFLVSDLIPGQPVSLVAAKEGFGTSAMLSVEPPTTEPVTIVLRPAGSLTGRVLDKSGDPIAGAMVHASLEYRGMVPIAVPEQRRPLATRTETDGSFRIEEVEPGRPLQVSVNAEGYQQQVSSDLELEPGGALELEIVLEIGAVVEGTVTTSDGEPVADATIEINEQQQGLINLSLVSAYAQSDFEGRYRVTGAPTGSVTVTLHGRQNQRLQKQIEVRPGTNLLDLVLDRGFEISGQVVTADGTPTGNASISLEQVQQAGLSQYSSVGASQGVVSRVDGTFALSGISAGSYKVIATREGYARAESETLEVAADVHGILLELHHGAALKGRVVGLELDDLGSLTLLAYSATGGMNRGQVDFSAQYSFDNLAGGQWHLQAQVASSGRSTTLQVEIPEGVAVVEKDIEFGTGFTLSGVVLSNGQPMPGVSVHASGGTNAAMGATDASGRFRLENLEAGRFNVIVSAGEGVHMEEVEIDGDREVQIEIPSGAITGTVSESGGRPLAGAKVTVELVETAGASSLSGLINFGKQGVSDSRGVFRLGSMRPGSYRVVANKPGYAPGEAMATVGVDTTPSVEIQMTPTEGITFEVGLASGAPLSSVQLAIVDPASGRRLTTDTYQVTTDGKVRVATVPQGLWELVIQGGDSAATRFAVTSPGDQGRFVLPPGGTLHIRVPELEQESMASVLLSGPDGKPFISTLGVAFGPGEWIVHAGQSMIPGLTPGPWTFTVRHGAQTWSGSATVAAGETTEVSLP